MALGMLVSMLFAMQTYATPSVSDLRQDKEDAQAQMDNLEDDLEYIVAKLGNLEADLVANGQAIIKNEEELKNAEAKEKGQYESMKLRIKAMYENGTGVMITKIFESGSLTEMLKQAEQVQTIHAYDRKQLEEYIQVKDKIKNLKETLQNDKAYLETKQKEYESEKADLNSRIEEKKDEIADYTSQIEEAVARASQSNNSPSPSGDYEYTPPANPNGGDAIVQEAYKYLGVPYVWGGMSSSGVDCSGLVLLAHKAIGVNLAHYSGSQGSGGKRVPSMSQALPGDVVCYVGHVGIYVGGGKMIHAPHTGDVVRVVSVYGSPWFRRYW